jgi:hypothetical protein
MQQPKRLENNEQSEVCFVGLVETDLIYSVLIGRAFRHRLQITYSRSR